MFLDDGDGVVFLGEFGPWYAPDTKQFHLKPEAAKNLLEGVIKTYEDLHGKRLEEVFLHAKSGINEDEFDGYRSAVSSSTKLVAVRVRPYATPFRLFRQGSWPVIRGTLLKVDDGRGLMWTAGFKPELATYESWETPVPLSLEVQHGEADIEQVATDIFGLTKLNYNACKLGDAQPVTVKFSDAVGEILIANPTVRGCKPQFRYYI
jgi:argonaute-like protein implicated in RNA metabolism and viral defense